MRQPKLFLSENQIKDKTYKDDLGFYDYDKNYIGVNLSNHSKMIKNEDELIDNLVDTIHHEYLHYVIWQCRKDYNNKLRYDFFEEKIIAEALNNEFKQEDYYYLIQEE